MNKIDPHGNMEKLQLIVGTWGEDTFGPSDGMSCLWHLAEELEEFFANPTPEELADCVLLILSFAHLRGFSLYDAVMAKHAINQARRWGAPDENGVRHHVEEGI